VEQKRGTAGLSAARARSALCTNKEISMEMRKSEISMVLTELQGSGTHVAHKWGVWLDSDNTLVDTRESASRTPGAAASTAAVGGALASMLASSALQQHT
jgi:hypothetical protein